MCGRFAFFSPREAVVAAFGAAPGAEFEPRYNIAPTQAVAVLRLADDASRRIDHLRWGLVPFWAKDPAIGSHMINARAETLAAKPAWRRPFRARRCVILADGFYEWVAKQPWFIQTSVAEPFGMAGLWDSWQTPIGESLLSCSIVTTVANDFMRHLHHRMPVILDAAGIERWLAPDSDMAERQSLLASPCAASLKAWPVARSVNSPRHDHADLIRPVVVTSVSV